MAQQVARAAEPVLDRSQRRAAGRPAADLAPAGADRHRPARLRRAAAQLPPPLRVGRGQRQHGARGLRRARAGGPGGQPPGPGHLRRRGDRGGRRSWRRSRPMRCAAPTRPASARASWRSSPRPAPACRAALEDVPPAPPADLPDLAEESEAIEVRHELRRQIARLEAELAAYPRDLPRDLPTAPRRASAHVAGVEELEQTRDTLIAQLSEAQRAAEQRARQDGRERVAGRQSPRAGDELVAAQAVARAVPARQVVLRAGRGDDDPHREDARLRGEAALSLRRGAGRPVPLRAQALLVPDDDLDLRPLPRRARAAGGRHPLPVRRPRPARRLLRPHRGPLHRRRSSPRRSSPASPAPRSPPTSAPARSARSSTPCRCSASTRSRTWSCRASWR